MTYIPNDPDANPTYGESKAINEQITGPGTGGIGTDAMTDPGAVIASQELADQMNVPVGTVVPSGTKVTPSTTPNSGGVTTIEYPATKSNGASVITVKSGSTDSGTPPPPSVFPTGFTAGNSDINNVQWLLDNHATLEQIQAYMALNNVDLNQLSGSQQSQLAKLGYTQPSDNSYEFDSPDKSIGKVYVPVNQWDNWTPAQQLAFQIKLKLTPSDAVLVMNKDGSWGYTSKSEAATQQANSGYTNGIPTDLYNTYLQNKDAYAAAGKPPPLNFDYTVDGQVTVTPYSDPSKAVSYAVPTGTQLFFNNVKGMPVIDKLTDLKGNTIVKANSDGSFNTDDVYTAFKSGTLSKTAAISLVGGTAFNQAQINAGIMTILNNPKNGLTDGKGNYDLAKALSQKNVTQTDLLEAGFTQDEINAALKPSKVTPISPANKLLGGSSPNYPSSYSQDDWDADIASGKIPKGATFVSYDSKTGTVNFTVLPTSPSTPLTPAQLAARNAALSAFEHATLAPPVAQVTSVKATKTGINLSIVNPAGKALATNIWNDIVAAAKSFNATHSGIGKIETIDGKQTVVRTAKSAGLPIIGGSIGEQLVSEGELEVGSGGSLTPVVLAAALAAVGVAITPTVKAAIEQEIAHYKTSHAGQAPTASQVTLTDSKGNIATLAEVVQMNQNAVNPPRVLEHPANEIKGQSILSSPAQTVAPIQTLQHPVGEVNMPSIESIPASGIKAPSIETIPVNSGPEPIRVLKATATASQGLRDTVIGTGALTPQQLEHLWGLNGGGAEQAGGMGASYLTAGSLEELDQEILKAYENGTLSQDEMDEYNRAKARYLKAKGLSDTAMSTATNTNYLKNGKISQSVYIAAVSAATLAALKAIEVKASPAQTQTMIKQAIYISVGVQTQPAVKQITQTAQQIATQQAVKAGLQVQTQQAIQEATKTQTIEQSKTAEQEQTQEQVQTKEQTQTKATTQEATQESTNENEKESEKEKEEELEDEDELTKPRLPKPNITKDAEGFVHVPQGSATWKQGFGYRTLVPPYDQKHFIFTMNPPKGAIIVPNAKSAKDTIQKLGKGNLPQDMNVKMGIMTVDVKDPPNKPQKHSGSIAFKRIPVTNNTGSRNAPPHVARIGNGITRRSDR